MTLRLPPKHCHVCGVELSDRRAIACNRHRHAAKRLPRQRSCAQCGESFTPYPSAMRRSAAKFCSRRCYEASVAPRLALIQVSCLNCGSMFRRTRAAVMRAQQVFCSVPCTAAYRQGERHPAWRGGHDANRGPGWARLAESIRERDGYRCRRCGKTQEENGARLPVDHIIPWRVFATAEEANDPSNLAAVCKSCHGRKARAERLWLKGDVIDMWQYQVAVAEPWSKPA